MYNMAGGNKGPSASQKARASVPWLTLNSNSEGGLVGVPRENSTAWRSLRVRGESSISSTHFISRTCIFGRTMTLISANKSFGCLVCVDM